MTRETSLAPDVSIIICTRNRPHLLPRALASILAQADPGATVELIVVDDGSEPPVRLPAGLPLPHQLIRTEHHCIGAARKTGLGAARGALIAYCDDDDEWTPDHLRVLLAALRAEPGLALVHGLSAWSPPAPAARDDAEALEGVAASDVLHRADAARDAGGFDPELRTLEDWDLWQRLQRCHPVRAVPRVVTIRHTMPGRIGETDDRAARDRIVDDLTRWRARSRRTARIRGDEDGPVPFNPATWTPERRQLLWQSSLSTAISFDRVARRLLPAVARQGVEIALGPLRMRCPPGFETYYRSAPDRGRLGFHYDTLINPDGVGCERLAHCGMWESTLVPCDQIGVINRAVSLLYVPCRQNLEACRDRGVRIPIKVLPHGVDAAEFPLLERPPRDVFTIGSHGNLGSARKGVDVLVRAVRAEFSRREPVRLLLHCSNQDGVPDWLRQDAAADPRIELVIGTIDHAALLMLLQRMDVFVLSSRGEGFGLTALEAMATGLPTIATNWSGPAEYLDPADSFPLAYRLVDAAGTRANGARYFGQWAEPDQGHLQALLRHLYEHQPKARAMGRRAAARVHAGWTWDRPAAQIVADFDVLARGISPSV